MTLDTCTKATSTVAPWGATLTQPTAVTRSLGVWIIQQQQHTTHTRSVLAKATSARHSSNSPTAVTGGLGVWMGSAAAHNTYTQAWDGMACMTRHSFWMQSCNHEQQRNSVALKQHVMLLPLPLLLSKVQSKCFHALTPYILSAQTLQPTLHVQCRLQASNQTSIHQSWSCVCSGL